MRWSGKIIYIEQKQLGRLAVISDRKLKTRRKVADLLTFRQMYQIHLHRNLANEVWSNIQ